MKDIDEVAAELGQKPWTVRRMVHRARIGFFRDVRGPGRKMMFTAEDVSRLRQAFAIRYVRTDGHGDGQ